MLVNLQKSLGSVLCERSSNANHTVFLVDYRHVHAVWSSSRDLQCKHINLIHIWLFLGLFLSQQQHRWRLRQLMELHSYLAFYRNERQWSNNIIDSYSQDTVSLSFPSLSSNKSSPHMNPRNIYFSSCCNHSCSLEKNSANLTHQARSQIPGSVSKVVWSFFLVLVGAVQKRINCLQWCWLSVIRVWTL